MKILSSTEYYRLLSSLILKLPIGTTSELSDDEKNIIVSEVYVLATIGTNYQEHNINDYINTLKRAIELKCQYTNP